MVKHNLINIDQTIYLSDSVFSLHLESGLAKLAALLIYEDNFIFDIRQTQDWEPRNPIQRFCFDLQSFYCQTSIAQISWNILGILVWLSDREYST